MIGKGEPCFIVAEVSCNHQQSFEQAKQIVRAAARAGADAVKIQTYTPDTITIDSNEKWFMLGGKDRPDSWKGKNLYSLYKEAYTPWEWDEPLKKLAEDLGLVFFSTPFDPAAVDFLEKLNVPCYKIASYEATDIPLLKRVAQTGKPVIMSVGFADLNEIDLSVKTLRDNGTKDLALLHCTTSYFDRADESATNLRTIFALEQRYGVVAGFSDNMGGIEAPALAVAIGAAIVEKHLVLKHDPAILDDRFSLDEEGMRRLVEKIRWQEKLMGEPIYGVRTEAEKENRHLRRSLFAVINIKQGEKFTIGNVRVIRPDYGLEPKYYDEVLGRIAARDIKRGTPLTWEMIQ